MSLTLSLDSERRIKDQNSKTKDEVIALVTGTLAEPALRRVAEELSERFGIQPLVVMLNIQVAALMTTEWIARKLELPAGQPIDRVLLPGYCRGHLEPLAAKLGVPVERGPVHLHDLPMFLGHPGHAGPGYGTYDIEIIAEINDAPRQTPSRTLAEAAALTEAGADVIDIGCDPMADRDAWPELAEVVTSLVRQGRRVSVDSFHPDEVRAACKAGAELVLSVNSTNLDLAGEFRSEVVAIPDTPSDLDSLDRTIQVLAQRGVPFRVDPIIEPIGVGFAASLGRYIEVRRRYPEAAMMMGIGNLSEMTEADSAAANMVLIGFCQELGIRSVLTTQVINWARTAVREIDIARRIMHFAVTHRTIPKHIDEGLVMLRDPKLRHLDEDDLKQLAERLTDRNIRIFADLTRGQIHAMNNRIHATGTDPIDLFNELKIDDASHAFYLGYEMAKAVTALTLGKNYVQDEPLEWGMLTRPEKSHGRG